MDSYVIIRSYKSGVFAGTLKRRVGDEVLLQDARRLWYWDGAFTLSALAEQGTSKPQTCKFSCISPQILILETIEVIPCSALARQSIELVPEWKP